MIKTIKNAFIVLASSASLLMPMAVPALVSAQGDINTGLCQGTQLDVNKTVCDPTNDTAANDRINNIIKTVINLFSLVVGLVSVITIIVGGLKYITSGGDSNNVTSAKNTILYALVGLVVVALAQFIVRFVLTKATT